MFTDSHFCLLWPSLLIIKKCFPFHVSLLKIDTRIWTWKISIYLHEKYDLIIQFFSWPNNYLYNMEFTFYFYKNYSEIAKNTQIKVSLYIKLDSWWRVKKWVFVNSKFQYFCKNNFIYRLFFIAIQIFVKYFPELEQDIQNIH